MTLDLAVLLVVILFTFLGYRRGLLRMLANLGALVIASLTAGLLARGIIDVVTSRSGMSSLAVYLLCCLGAWLLIFIVARIVLGVIARKLGCEKEGAPKPWNKKLGALFGAIEALVFAWFTIGMLDALPEDFRKERIPQVHQQLTGSLFTNWVVRPTSPATMFEIQPLISDLAVLTGHPEALRGIEGKPEIKKLIANDKVKAVLNDQSLIEDWRAGRYNRFFSAPKVRDALEDAEVRQMLRDLPIRTILHDAAQSVRKKTP